jgi:hypothetical protein
MLLYGDRRFYVGQYSGQIACKRFMDATNDVIPFPDGEEISYICEFSEDVYVGFAVATDGRFEVEVPVDDEGNAITYQSLDCGYVWTEV